MVKGFAHMPAATAVAFPSGRGPRLGARTTGFTLIELMVTVAVAAVLLGVGLPSFREALQNQRVKTAASDMFLSLILARSEAIKRSANIDLARHSTDWVEGWDVRIASDSTVLRQNDALKNLTIACNTDADTAAETCPSSVTFNRSGRPGAFIEFWFYQPDSEAVTMRCVTMSLSGRPSIVMDVDHDASNGCK